MPEIQPTDTMQWIKPLASFTPLVTRGYQIEIPAHVTKPLHIQHNDVIEIAYVGDNADHVTVFHTVVGDRNRVGLKKYIAAPSGVIIGDHVLVGILSVFHSRSNGLVVVFDTEAIPEWYDGDRED
jgi:bifunctional DNA-binding transcriptional regulator/antitoxin component of YhaV-PrlF toxin-antitoxin module